MRAIACVALLGGCVGGASAPSGPSTDFRLDARGIDVIGTDQRIDFGRDRAGVASTMARMRGQAPDTLSCRDPGMTVLAWNDGLDLIFVNNAFVGWWSNDPARSSNGENRAGPTCER